MKSNYDHLLLILLLFLAACTPQAAISDPALPDSTEIPVGSKDATKSILKTNDGDLVYVSARFVDETPMETPAPGYKLLVVILERADGQAIDLESFNAEHVEIVVHGDDGSRTLSTMGGFLGEEFAIGFRVPDNAATFTLEWGDNPPIMIEPNG